MIVTTTDRRTGAVLEAITGPLALQAARTAVAEVAKRDGARMGSLRPCVHHFGDRVICDIPATNTSIEVEIEDGGEAAAILHQIHVWEPRLVDHTLAPVADHRLAGFLA